jgi:lipoate-protein ligase A
MRLLTYTAAFPALDLALEEALQAELEEGAAPETWRVWQAQRHSVVLGTGQQAALEADLDAARTAGVPVLRRHSGGGAVLIGPGVLQYSGFFRIADLAGGETIRGAMHAGLAPVVTALNRLGVEVRETGLSDLAVTAADGSLQKLAGNAQARKRVSVLVHGTLLADPDWELMERLLRFPSRVPDYRGQRGHREFLTSLRALRVPPDLSTFAESLATVLGPDLNRAQEPAEMELRRAREFLETKYSRDEWNLRR